MLIDVPDEQIDNIMLNKIKYDIKVFKEYLEKLEKTDKSEGVFSYDYEIEHKRLIEMFEAATNYLKWYDTVL